MKVERVHGGIRYTLTNVGLRVNDEVYPIARGRCLDDKGWILHDFDWDEYRSGFLNKPHIILDLKYSETKPYEVRTDHGFGPKEMYFKIIKKEEQVERKGSLFGSYEWIEIK